MLETDKTQPKSPRGNELSGSRLKAGQEVKIGQVVATIDQTGQTRIASSKSGRGTGNRQNGPIR